MSVELIESIKAALLSEYTDKKGNTMSGMQGIARNLITTAMNSNNKQCIAAIKILLEMFGANISELDREIKIAEAEMIKAKTEMLTAADTAALDMLDDILKEMKENADTEPKTE